MTVATVICGCQSICVLNDELDIDHNVVLLTQNAQTPAVAGVCVIAALLARRVAYASAARAALKVLLGRMTWLVSCGLAR